MPVVHFSIRWPDGAEERCYSPSRVIREHLAAGATYAMPEFLERVRVALTQASERVKARYGYYCSASLDQLADIEAAAKRFAGESSVHVLEFDPEE